LICLLGVFPLGCEKAKNVVFLAIHSYYDFFAKFSLMLHIAV